LYKEVILKGAHPILRVGIPGLAPFFYKHAKKHQIEKFPDHFDYAVKSAQKYIGVSTESNTKELTEVDGKKITTRQKIVRPAVAANCNFYQAEVMGTALGCVNVALKQWQDKAKRPNRYFHITIPALRY